MIIAVSILFLFSFLLGFFAGKYYNKKNGYQAGLAEAPLLLRQQSLEQGYCMLCGTEKTKSL